MEKNAQWIMEIPFYSRKRRIFFQIFYNHLSSYLYVHLYKQISLWNIAGLVIREMNCKFIIPLFTQGIDMKQWLKRIQRKQEMTTTTNTYLVVTITIHFYLIGLLFSQVCTKPIILSYVFKRRFSNEYCRKKVNATLLRKNHIKLLLVIYF